MEGVPSPLQVGSPANARRASESVVPAALRAGSPANGAFSDRPRLVRHNTSGSSNRLSQLFPSRPPSAASFSPPESAPPSRRTSYPSPIAPSEPSYFTSRAPPPPSYSQDTSYSSTPSAFSPQGTSTLVNNNSGTKRLLNRLNSLRTGGSGGGQYNKLEDVETGPSWTGLGGVPEVDEPVGYDLSGFDGMPMKTFAPQKKQMSAADARERERHMSEAGLAAEFERLESQLGAGMNSVIEKPFTHIPSQPQLGVGKGHSRGLSAADLANANAQDAQKVAEKTGGIVAVADIPVDISDFAGGADFDTRSIMTTETGLAKDEAQTSYFFPPGKHICLCDILHNLTCSQTRICQHGGRSQWAGHG